MDFKVLAHLEKKVGEEEEGCKFCLPGGCTQNHSQAVRRSAGCTGQVAPERVQMRVRPLLLSRLTPQGVQRGCAKSQGHKVAIGKVDF